MSCCGRQSGGGVGMPFRWNHPQATPFNPAGSACSVCGGKKKMKGGSIRMPYRWFNADATPFNPSAGKVGCGCGNPQCKCGSGKPCAKCGGMKGGAYGNPLLQKQAGPYDYYNDFGCFSEHDYNSNNMTNPGCHSERAAQRGGTAIGAPFYVFTQGNTPVQANPIREGPAMDAIPKSRFWCNRDTVEDDSISRCE